jgi:hypothetical protein
MRSNKHVLIDYASWRNWLFFCVSLIKVSAFRLAHRPKYAYLSVLSPFRLWCGHSITFNLSRNKPYEAFRLWKDSYLKATIIHVPVGSQLEHRASFGISVITYTLRHMAGLLWMSDQPVAETSTYTGQHNIQTQETNIHATSGILTRDPSNQAVADLCLRSRGHLDRQKRL